MMSSSLRDRRSAVRIGLAIASTLAVASSLHAASRLEIYGTVGTNGGSLYAETTGISWDGGTLAWSLGTYAHSGGQVPEGGVVAGGGIDAALSVATWDGVALGTHDNLSATNKDAEIRTAAATGRAGSVVIPPQNWVQSLKWTMSTAPGAALGNRSFTVVSYLPGDSLQYFDNAQLSDGASITGVYATQTRFSAPAAGTMTITDRVRLVDGSALSVHNGSINAKNVTMENNSNLSITGSGFLESDYIEFGDASNDRSTISITGTGGIKARSFYLASNTTAAVTVEQRSGLVDVGSLGFKWVNIPPTTNVSHYHLYGGTLKVESLVMKDAILHVAGGRLESKWLFSQRIDEQSVENNSRVAWESGTIAFTQESTTPLSTGSVFGSTLTLGAGRTLELNAPGLTSFVNLNGGTLSLRELADDGLRMNWQAGELKLTGTAGATLAAGRSLGDQLTLRSGMTLRTAAPLTVDVGSRLLLNDGGRAIVRGINNKGTIRLGGSGEAWIDASGPTAIESAGLITGTGQITGWIGNLTPGRVELASADDLRIVGGLVNDGAVRVSGGTLTVKDTLTNKATGKLIARGILAGSAIDNYGTVTLAGGLTDVDVATTRNRQGSKTIVTGEANAIFYGNVTNDAGSSFDVAAGSRATFLGSVTNLAAFTGGGTKVFHGQTTGGLLSSAGGETIVESSGALSAAGIRESSLTLRGTARLLDNSGVSKLNAITFDGGSLDVRNNTLVLDYAATSPIDQIRAAMSAGVLSSSSLSNGRVLALIDGASVHPASLGGVSFDASSLVLALTLRGDATLDGSVNFDDLLTLAKHYNSTGRTWTQADFSGDGLVNFDDLLQLAKHYGGSVRSAQAAAQMSGIDAEAFAADYALAQALVPEPTTLGFFGAIGLLVNRRRRK